MYKFYLLLYFLRKSNKIFLYISFITIFVNIIIIILIISLYNGFNYKVFSNITNFSGHINILVDNKSNIQYQLKTILTNNKIINNIYPVIYQYSFLQNKDYKQNIILKFISQNYYKSYYDIYMIDGKLNNDNDNNIVISKILSHKLNVKVNDIIKLYYLNDILLEYSFTITGIYETGIDEIDNLYILSNINCNSKLEINRYELYLSSFNYKNINFIKSHINILLKNNINILSIYDIHNNLWHFISLLSRNYTIVIILISLISIINITSSIFIFILKNVYFITILKILGSSKKFINNIFKLYWLFITIICIITANCLCLFIIYIQNIYKIIKLDASIYFINYLPMYYNILHTMIVNIIIIILSYLILNFANYIFDKTPINNILNINRNDSI